MFFSVKFFLFSVPFFFFFNDTATTEIYTLSLHDALPISPAPSPCCAGGRRAWPARQAPERSEEHTSELQSHLNLVCRLLLEKKKNETARPLGVPRLPQRPPPPQDAHPP